MQEETPVDPLVGISRSWFYCFIFGLWLSDHPVAQVLTDCHFVFLMVCGPAWAVYLFCSSLLRVLDQADIPLTY